MKKPLELEKNKSSALHDIDLSRMLRFRMQGDLAEELLHLFDCDMVFATRFHNWEFCGGILTADLERL